MPRVAAKKDKTILKVGNTEIIIGNVYELTDKKDLDAPAPKKGVPTAKIPFPGNAQYSSVAFDETTRRWDTGFEENSACARFIPSTEKSARIKTYIEHVKKPFEEFYREDCSAVNDSFWGGSDKDKKPPYQIELYRDKTYKTDNPKDLFDLFQALIHGKVCEEGEREPHLKKDAVYTLISRDKNTSREEKRLFKKEEAYSTFRVLLDSLDPEKDDTLYTILEWIGYSSIRGSEKETIKKIVLRSFETEKTGQDTIERFLNAYNLSKTESGKLEMELFAVLQKLNLKNKIQKINSVFYLDGERLGNTLKEAAKIALNNPDLKDKIVDVWGQVK